VPCVTRRIDRTRLLDFQQSTKSQQRARVGTVIYDGTAIALASTMTSEAIRDPRTDSLLTPANSALVIIDYQPSQIGAVKSMDVQLLERNIVSVARLGRPTSFRSCCRR
jgi:hypothetical protein